MEDALTVPLGTDALLNLFPTEDGVKLLVAPAIHLGVRMRKTRSLEECLSDFEAEIKLFTAAGELGQGFTFNREAYLTTIQGVTHQDGKQTYKGVSTYFNSL